MIDSGTGPSHASHDDILARAKPIVLEGINGRDAHQVIGRPHHAKGAGVCLMSQVAFDLSVGILITPVGLKYPIRGQMGGL